MFTGSHEGLPLLILLRSTPLLGAAEVFPAMPTVSQQTPVTLLDVSSGAQGSVSASCA